MFFSLHSECVSLTFLGTQAGDKTQTSMKLKISRVSNFRIVASLQYEQDIQAGQNAGRKLIVKLGIITNMEDHGDTKSNMELAANVSLLFILKDDSPSSSPLL